MSGAEKVFDGQGPTREPCSDASSILAGSIISSGDTKPSTKEGHHDKTLDPNRDGMSWLEEQSRAVVGGREPRSGASERHHTPHRHPHSESRGHPWSRHASRLLVSAPRSRTHKSTGLERKRGWMSATTPVVGSEHPNPIDRGIYPQVAACPWSGPVLA